MVSLDVESLFSHVPILPTIEIILISVYRHPELPPPKILENILKNLLHDCMTETPFRSPTVQLYLQVEGVAMSLPLGSPFTDYCMCSLDNTVLQDPGLKPVTYCRCVDEIFIEIRSESHLIDIKLAMETASVLHFTYELNIYNKIPFLDILIHSQDNTYFPSAE
ncbi:uncharacterized protein LOC143028042 [Oratosquilla oratoria]|uniref:uncharacterized protein LOC143028042 n=1 Tax=Oratosquilla oratoria TaxID=337810 RepID=UPI003F76F387